MLNLKGYNLLFGKKAVSPVIGVILMVAVTVIMAAIVGGFVYQTARPKVPPSMSSSLADDSTKGLGDTKGDVRIAKLYFEGGQSIDKSEFNCIVSYTDNSTGSGVEQTVVLDGSFWEDDTPVAMGTNYIQLEWMDSDNSQDISPGDRLDFVQDDSATYGDVKPNSDFTVKVLHKPTEAFVADHTIRVY